MPTLRDVVAFGTAFPVLLLSFPSSVADDHENSVLTTEISRYGASPDLLRQSAETLAGRIAYDELPGLSLAEVGEQKANRLWV
ncbi:MAG: hypothetical protein ACLGI7_07000, partial [Gammaproteobacteria bacterium]